MDKNKINPIPEEFSDVQNEMRTRFSLLPEDIQKTITSSDYQMKLYEIAKKTKLTYEQLGVLEMETTMVLLGMTEPEDFQTEVQAQLKLDPKVTADIVTEVSEQVFKTIRESLKKVYTAKEQTESVINEGLNPGGATTELKKSGIEINKVPESTYSNSNKPAQPNRNELLKGIENPPKGSGLSLAEQKLAGTFSMPTKETSYVPKSVLPPVPKVPSAPITPVTPVAPVAPTSEKPSSDSYREPI